MQKQDSPNTEKPVRDGSCREQNVFRSPVRGLTFVAR